VGSSLVDTDNHTRTGRGIYHTSDVVAREVRAWLGERHLLLITDFDGTLSKLAPTPDDAVMSAEVRRALGVVAVHPRTTLAVVSGRRIDDVRDRTEAVAAYVGGLHGLEIAGPSSRFAHPALARAAVAVAGIRAEAERALAWCPQAVLEDKTYALTLHVRRVPPGDAGKALGQFVELAQPALDADLLRVLPGAQVLELLPAVDWHKGKAVEWIRSAVDVGPTTGVGVVYLGDDRTDEDAFATIGMRGVSIGVGDRPHDHLIRFRLASPASVGRFFERLCEGM
jgi:trehalose-phosphatase